MDEAYLALEDGRMVTARGRVPGRARGELVFTTAYTGYEESLTDPSYEEQVLTFAYPLIGNYGVNAERFESDRVHPRAVIAHELTNDVVSWLADENVPAIDHIDTRDLVVEIRDGGAMRCGLAVGPDATPEAAKEELAACKHMSDHRDIGQQVGVSEPTIYRGNGEATVMLIDCGAKSSIIDSLVERGADVHVYPNDTTIDAVESLDPDIVFISNGPGDPANFQRAESLVEETAGERPIAGICLGQQIVARAMGGSTEKMRFGHRGANQPVRDLRTDQVVITTQNHGYTVADPGDLTVTQINVNDDTPEGMEDPDQGVITRQYHPEANPGPHDTMEFFDDVLALANAN